MCLKGRLVHLILRKPWFHSSPQAWIKILRKTMVSSRYRCPLASCSAAEETCVDKDDWKGTDSATVWLKQHRFKWSSIFGWNPQSRLFTSNLWLSKMLTSLKFESLPLKSYGKPPKGSRIVFQRNQPSMFRGELLNFGGCKNSNKIQQYSKFESRLSPD